MRRMARAALLGLASPAARASPRSFAGLPRRARSHAAHASPPAPTPPDVRGATLRWLDAHVIGLNLCPFARAPRVADGIRLVVSEATGVDALFAEFHAEAERLAATYTDADAAYDEHAEAGDDENARLSRGHSPRRRNAAASSRTTLIAYGALPELADDFVLFLAVAERCEAMLEESGLDARIQLATFHPAYRFEGEEIQDPGSFTNRSPYPTMHLLRVVDVSRAIDGFEGNTEDIPAANVEVLRDVGLETLAKRLKALVAWRADEKGEDANLSKKE